MSRLRVSSAILLALLALASTAIPVAAVDAADYVLFRWTGPGPRGMGIIDGTSNTAMVEVLGLQANTDYRVVASSRACNRAHVSGARVIGFQFDTAAAPNQFVGTTFDDSAAIGSTRSVRLFKGDSQVDCGMAEKFRALGSGEPIPTESVSFAIINGQGGVFGMIRVDIGAGDDQIGVALHGLVASRSFRIVGADEPCPGPASASSRRFRHEFGSSASGTAFFDLGAELAITSHTYVNRVGSGQVGCSQNIIVANTWGDL